jgi:hypothetical protein
MRGSEFIPSTEPSPSKTILGIEVGDDAIVEVTDAIYTGEYRGMVQRTDGEPIVLHVYDHSRQKLVACPWIAVTAVMAQ